MRSPFTKLYVHLVGATWDRQPFIGPAIKARLAGIMGAKCRELGAEPLAIGMVADHAHLLVRIPPTLAVSLLVKEVKGASSHLVTHVVAPDATFKWQGGYGAFTVGPRELPIVAAYVANQERHHRSGDLKQEWEADEELER